MQEAVVNVDGGLELLQASGFELVFDESSPEPQAAAALAPGMSSQSQGSTSAGLAQSGSQSSSGLPFGDAWLKGTSDAEASGQGQMAPAMAEVSSCTITTSFWQASLLCRTDPFLKMHCNVPAIRQVVAA